MHNAFEHSTAETVVQVGAVNGDLRYHPEPRSARPTPRQLPAPPKSLAGRDQDLSFLDHALERATAAGEVPLLIIEGTAGMGKSALAVTWAHRHAQHYPDGQLFADLGEGRSHHRPAPPLLVLHAFLLSLGVATRAIPPDEESAAALFRSTVAPLSVLIVLDNATNAEQVRPLLPATPSCAVVITSRVRLAALHLNGAVSRRLSALAHPDARRLLENHLGGDAVTSDPRSVDKLIEHCGGLPLALAIVAARAAAHPDFPLTHLVDELEESTNSLDVYETGDGSISLRAVLSLSYTSLDEEHARVFRLLGAVRVTEVDVDSATSLLARPRRMVLAALSRLEAGNLLWQRRPNRFSMHALVRAHAAELGAEHDEPGVTVEAVRRWVDFYVHTANAADRCLYPYRSRVALPASTPGCTPLEFATHEGALAWFADEHPRVLAALDEANRRDWPELVWHLSRGLDTYHYRRGHLVENVRTSRLGTGAAEVLGDPLLAAMAQRQLGRALTRVGDFTGAARCLHRALSSIDEESDPKEAAHTHHDLSRVCTWSEDYAGARSHSSEAVRLYRLAGDRIGETHALNGLGRAQAELGEDAAARVSCHAALDLAVEIGNLSGQAVIVDNLGFLARRSGDLAEAEAWYEEALSLASAQGTASFEAEVAEHLAQVLVGRDPRRAVEMFRRAHDLYEAQQRTAEAERCRSSLAELS